MNLLIGECPHCLDLVIIEQVNCGIFRHAVYKSNWQPINPHASQEECERYVREDLVWGCGKPFQIIGKKFVKCGYI